MHAAIIVRGKGAFACGLNPSQKEPILSILPLKASAAMLPELKSRSCLFPGNPHALGGARGPFFSHKVPRVLGTEGKWLCMRPKENPWNILVWKTIQKGNGRKLLEHWGGEKLHPTLPIAVFLPAV